MENNSLLPTLKEVVAYQHEGVIRRFCYDNPAFSVSQIQQDFQDLLAWLWLNVKRRKLGRKTYIFGPLRHLDNLWHLFILHTRDYSSFCTHFFNEYIHHETEPPGEEYLVSESDLEEFLSDAYDHLGHAWVSKWFQTA
jgi:hypothetical protein